jgi:endonuclease-3
LIVTVMSQHTSDVNRDRAYGRLRERFPSWEQVVDAPVEEVADAIRPGGIADVKARRIQEILGEIERRESGLDLDRLNELPDAEVVDYLCSLPGVGQKTAACVLVFAMGRDAFPVDTHVHRVVTRLGLAPSGSAEAAHRLLEPAIPPELRYELHVQLIRHGREICKPRMPLCSQCVLFDLCEAGPNLMASGDAR